VPKKSVKVMLPTAPPKPMLHGQFATCRWSCLGLVPFCGWDGGQVEVLGVLQPNVSAKRFVERFTGFAQSTWERALERIQTNALDLANARGGSRKIAP
jgi:hypothetical protein